MYRLLTCLMACALLCLPASAATGLTTVIASKIVDASGNPLASGTVSFQVVDASAKPLSVRMGGGGQTISTPATGTVTNGAFSVPVVDVSMTTPSMPCIAVTVIDNATGDPVYQNPCIQPTGPVYSLDNFTTNTTPILPQAGSTVAGNLSVNGNFSTTGTFQPGAVITNYVEAQSLNGVINAATFGGSDIGQKVNAAYSTCSSRTCEVVIPAGNYTYSSDIVMPNKATTTLSIGAGATLTYTGSGCAIRTSTGPNYGAGHYEGLYFISGGHVIGTSSAKCGILLASGVNASKVANTAIDGFTSGDGILDVGTNSATVEDSKISGNLVGLHLMASPGYASNNVLAKRNVIQGNRWAIVNGDVSQWSNPWMYTGTTGVSSPNYNNVFLGNDLENNTAGAAIEGLTVGSQYIGNYVEANPRGIVIGMTENPLPSGAYASLYGVSGQNGGTAKDAELIGNYFTTGSYIHSLIELRAAAFAKVDGNATDGPATACFVDLYIGNDPWIGQNDTANVTKLLCQGGAPGWTLANTLQAPLVVQGNINGTGGLAIAGGGSFGGTLSANAATLGGAQFGAQAAQPSIGGSCAPEGYVLISKTVPAHFNFCSGGVWRQIY